MEYRTENHNEKDVEMLLTKFLDESVFDIGKDSFSQIPENIFLEQLKAQKKLMLPMDESNEIMERILDEVTAEKLDDFVSEISNDLQPFMNRFGAAFTAVMFHNINPIVLFKKKVGS